MLRPGHVVALCTLALLTLGVIMVASAGLNVGPVNGAAAPATTMTSIILTKNGVFMVLALGAMAAASLFPVRRLASAFSAPTSSTTDPRTNGLLPLGLMVAATLVTLALVYTPIGKSTNGSHRWLRLPVPGLGDKLSMQPSELAKWFFIGVVAWYAVRRREVLDQFWLGLVPALAAVGIVSGFIVLEDLGTGFLVAVVACLVLIAGGARIAHFLMFVPVGVGGVVAAILSSEYRLARVTAFLDPYSDARKSGYHMIQSMWAIAGGEGAGRGLGHGHQKFGYLPEDQTDFLFSIICEELGVAGAAAVIAVFVALLWAGLAILRRERDPMLKLFTLGVIATIAIQTAINLVVVTGLGPTKGIALPLVSAGGTGWILTAFSLGLLIAIDRAQARDEQAADVAASAVEEPAPEIVVTAATPATVAIG